MKNPHGPTRSARHLAWAAATTALVAGLLPTATVAAATNCSYVAATKAATINVNGAVTTKVGRNAAGAILVDGTACGAATVTNTDTIAILGDASAQSITLALASGGFAPGATAEAAGTSDIEISLNLGAGNDALAIGGTGAADTIKVGSGGVDPNDDGDVDFSMTSVEGLRIDGGNGNDNLYGTGVNGGPGTSIPLKVYGGNGNDDLRGGLGGDMLYGGAGEDALRGYEGDDSLDGGLDGDLLTGGTGVDVVSYATRTSSIAASIDGTANDGALGEGDNITAEVENVTGGSGADQVTGSSAGNVLLGGPGNDTINGGPGADTLDGGAGADTFTGGAGNDTVSYAARTAAITAWIGGPASGEAGEGDVIDFDVEALRGGSANDVLGDSAVGGAAPSFLFGHAGNDTLHGGGGNDQLYGGEGNDTLIGGTGSNQLFGEAGDDTYQAGDQTLVGVVGADAFSGGPGTDTADYGLRSAAVFVTLNGIAADGQTNEFDNIANDVERVAGGSASDALTGNGNANRFYGNGGNDTLGGLGGLDFLEGGNGNDTINGGDANDTLIGGAGNDTLIGGAGNDSADGGGHNDILDGGVGDDTLNGGNDFDVVTYEAHSSGVSVNLWDGVANEGSAGEYDGFVAIEIVKGSPFNDVLKAADVGMWLYGGAGTDELFGGAGYDHIHGGPNGDWIHLSETGHGPAADDVCSLDGAVDYVGFQGGYINYEADINEDFDGVSRFADPVCQDFVH